MRVRGATVQLLGGLRKRLRDAGRYDFPERQRDNTEYLNCRLTSYPLKISMNVPLLDSVRTVLERPIGTSYSMLGKLF